jgi:rRNA maturation RNase YbeY
MNNIHFFKEDIRFRLICRQHLVNWIGKAVRENNYELIAVNYIFCSDRYLLKLNKKYLDHHFKTDIITFDNAVSKKKISGDIFISIERVIKNAARYEVTFNDELNRVMIHGILHLLGYRDKTLKERAGMRRLEDDWLKKRNWIQK